MTNGKKRKLFMIHHLFNTPINKEKIIQKLRVVSREKLPVILFFFSLFFFISYFFGLSYIFFVVNFTFTFKMNYQKHLSFYSLIRLAITLFFLGICGFLASTQFIWLIILNLLVPFIVVTTSSLSRFNQFEYFPYYMCFILCELMVVPSFTAKLGGFTFGLGFTLLWLIAIQKCLPTNKKMSQMDYQQGFQLISTILEKYNQKESYTVLLPQLEMLMKKLYKQIPLELDNREIIKGRRDYNYALLFQRAVYFFKQPNSLSFSTNFSQNCLLSCAKYFKSLSQLDWQSKDEMIQCKNEAEELSNELKRTTDEYSKFLEILITHVLFLFDLPEDHKDSSMKQWYKSIKQFRIKNKLLLLINESFERRMAVKFSITLIVSFIFMYLIGLERTYWLPMMVLYILRPSNEDSIRFAKIRFYGTLIGGCLSLLLLTIFPYLWVHLTIACVTGTFVFVLVPSITQVTLSTIFAISLSTLTISNIVATELRIFYVLIAIVIVLMVNLIFFPINKNYLLHYNLKQLFRLQSLYLEIFKTFLEEKVDYTLIVHLHIHYNLSHDQTIELLQQMKLPKKELLFYEKTLGDSWLMIANIEQMIHFTNMYSGLDLPTKNRLSNNILSSIYVLNIIGEKLGLNKNMATKFCQIPTSFEREFPGNKELTIFFTQYTKLLSQLYQITCAYENKLRSKKSLFY